MGVRELSTWSGMKDFVHYLFALLRVEPGPSTSLVLGNVRNLGSSRKRPHNPKYFGKAKNRVLCWQKIA